MLCYNNWSRKSKIYRQYSPYLRSYAIFYSILQEILLMLYIFLYLLNSLMRCYDYLVQFLMGLLLLSSLITKFLPTFLITILNPIKLFLPYPTRAFIIPIINPLRYNLRVLHITRLLFHIIITITMRTICCTSSSRCSFIIEDVFVGIFSCF